MAAQRRPAWDALGQPGAVALQPASQQRIGLLLADGVAGLHRRTVGVAGAARTDRPGLGAGLGIGIGAELAAFELLHQGQGEGNSIGSVGYWSRCSHGRHGEGLRRWGAPELPQAATFLQGPGLIDHQPLQHRQQPGPVVIQLRIEMGDVVASRNGAAHRNNPRRPGARAGWLLLAAICMPEGKNRALTVIQRSKQAFT